MIRQKPDAGYIELRHARTEGPSFSFHYPIMLVDSAKGLILELAFISSLAKCQSDFLYQDDQYDCVFHQGLNHYYLI